MLVRVWRRDGASYYVAACDGWKRVACGVRTLAFDGEPGQAEAMPWCPACALMLESDVTEWLLGVSRVRTFEGN